MDNALKSKPSTLIFGDDGQLGSALQMLAQERKVTQASKSGCDIHDASAVRELIRTECPDWIINAAAYTAVDKAESEMEYAFRTNRDGAANIARAALEYGSRMIQISTDYVFDGKQSHPYRPDDLAKPLSVYGLSKLEGEVASSVILGQKLTIIRTAWLYGGRGHNFVKTVIERLNANQPLKVVDDQIGTPTEVLGLAEAVWRAVDQNLTGILQWTDSGVASWYDFAVAIAEEGRALGLIRTENMPEPIATTGYRTAARRPAYSVLDKSDSWEALGLRPPHWRTALRASLSRMAARS